MMRRDGKLLIVEHDAYLPLRCVRCNAVATRIMPVQVRCWRNARPIAFYNPVLERMLGSPKALIRVGLCTRHLRGRFIAVVAMNLIAVAIMAAVFMLIHLRMLEGGGIVAGGLVVIAAAIWWPIHAMIVISRPPVRSQWMSETEVALSGCCDEYLDGKLQDSRDEVLGSPAGAEPRA